MDRAAVKKWLGRGFGVGERIRAAEYQIRRLREQRGGLGSSLLMERVSGGKTSDPVGELAAGIAEAETAWTREVTRLLVIKAEIKAAIERVPEDGGLRLALAERYINLKTWEEISADNYWSRPTVQRKLRRGIEYIVKDDTT